MLTIAFDCGGDDGTEYLTVAGFASSARDWDSFSEQWKKRLDQDGIAFFRTVDANALRGPFEHWRDLPEDESKRLRKNLFADLMDIIRRHIYQKFSCTIVNKAYAATENAARKEFAESAYSLAARTCEKNGRHWLMHDPYWANCKKMLIRAVFELGDGGQDEGKMKDRLRKEYGNIPPIFMPKKDTLRDDGTIEYGFVPLQAADWLAWEINRATQSLYSGKIDSLEETRWPMQQFLTPPSPFFRIYALEDFNKMNDMIDLISRVPRLRNVFRPQEKED